MSCSGSAMRRLLVTSVMGLMERRETVARVRVEELRGEAERVLAELAGAEAVWDAGCPR